MEWQKIEPMHFAVFEKMWVIVISDTRYMDTKKQCPESVLWTILMRMSSNNVKIIREPLQLITIHYKSGILLVVDEDEFQALKG